MTNAKPNVLLLDDDEEVLNMLKLFLAMLEVNVAAFSNPEHALEYFTSHASDIDCFLCDLVMTPKNGLEVLETTRSISVKTPFYLMSANASSKDLERANDLAVTGFIEKPMVHLQLEKVISSLRQTTSEEQTA